MSDDRFRMAMTEDFVRVINKLNKMYPWDEDSPHRTRDRYMQQTQVGALCAIADLLATIAASLAGLAEVQAMAEDRRRGGD